MRIVTDEIIRLKIEEIHDDGRYHNRKLDQSGVIMLFMYLSWMKEQESKHINNVDTVDTKLIPSKFKEQFKQFVENFYTQIGE